MSRPGAAGRRCATPAACSARARGSSAGAIEALGGRALQRRLGRRAPAPQPRAARRLRLSRAGLPRADRRPGSPRAPREGGLLFCHPCAAARDAGDPIAAARRREAPTSRATPSPTTSPPPASRSGRRGRREAPAPVDLEGHDQRRAASRSPARAGSAGRARTPAATSAKLSTAPSAAVTWKRSHAPNVAPRAAKRERSALPANATWAPTQAPSAAAHGGASRPALDAGRRARA